MEDDLEAASARVRAVVRTTPVSTLRAAGEALVQQRRHRRRVMIAVSAGALGVATLTLAFVVATPQDASLVAGAPDAGTSLRVAVTSAVPEVVWTGAGADPPLPSPPMARAACGW